MILTRQSLVFAALILGALIIEVAILVWFFDERAEDDPVLRDVVESPFGESAACGDASPSDAAPNYRFGSSKRFAVEVPPTWKSKSEGSVVTLSKRNGRATLSLGRARSGDLLQALQDLRAHLRRSYRDLAVTSIEPITIDGCPGRSVAGRALNRNGARLNFEGVVVAGPTDNFVIAAFHERGSEPRLNATMQRVIRSVRFYLSEEGDQRPRS
jgi:hypothetical protein